MTDPPIDYKDDKIETLAHTFFGDCIPPKTFCLRCTLKYFAMGAQPGPIAQSN